MWLLQNQEDMKSFPFYFTFLRKARSSCSGNEGWWYSTICCSSTTPCGNLIQTQNAILVRRGFALYMWIKTFKALRDAILLIFQVIQNCSGFSLHWWFDITWVSSMRWREKHLQQIVTYWSKSKGMRYWLHRGTEQWLGIGEDVLLINCRKRTEKILS